MKSAERNPIIQWTDYTIDFLDALIIRVCPLILTVGFIIGAIATFSTDFNINSSPLFNMVWSLSQAIAIDGLFFSVWSLWRRSSGWLRWWYGMVGTLLACTVALVNNIVSYAELQRYHTIAQSMHALSIDPAAFTVARATLIALVAILMITLPRSNEHKGVEESDTVQAQVAVPSEGHDTIQEHDAIDEHKGVEEGAVDQPVEPSYGVQKWASPYADNIAELYKNNPSITPKEVVEALGCSITVARKWLERVRVTPIESNGYAHDTEELELVTPGARA